MLTPANQFLVQKVRGAVRAGQKSCAILFGMFVNFVWPSKLANIPPCYVFDTSYPGELHIEPFVGKVDTHSSRQKVGNYTVDPEKEVRSEPL